MKFAGKFMALGSSVVLAAFILFQAAAMPCHGQDRTGEIYPKTTDDIIENGFFRVFTEEELDRARDAAYRPPGPTRANLISDTILGSYTGTGISEDIEYQIPTSYDPLDPPPMLVCWHRYSQSCYSVSVESQLNEECEARGWIYLSITGAIQENFGYLLAQQNCTRAIDYMMDPIDGLGYVVDTDRIYMTGCSMGGGAAFSYAARHLSDVETYRVAGLILIAAPVDWIHAYNSGDLGVQTYLPVLLGGTPTQETFYWKQISGIYLVGHAVMVDESMGLNLQHNCPIFVARASNDPLTYTLAQIQILESTMLSLGGNIVVDYVTNSPTPHNWDLLDYTTALDWIGSYSLADQEDESLSLVMDRETKFFWLDLVEQTTRFEFSQFQGEVDAVQNALTVDAAENMTVLEVDCDWAGLGDQKNLLIDYTSSSTTGQELLLSPIPTEPTYIVDDAGVLFPDYTYNPASDQSQITCGGHADLDLKTSFEEYNLTLSAPDLVEIDEMMWISLGAGGPNDLAAFFLGFTQQEFQVGWSHLLVPPISPTVLFVFRLDLSGNKQLGGRVPNDPALIGTIFYQQFITYDTVAYEIMEISNLEMTEVY